MRVGYVPGPTTPLSFVPIAPKRAYDSRFVAPLGPLPNNTNRVISVADSYVTGTGTLEQANIIPAYRTGDRLQPHGRQHRRLGLPVGQPR